MGNLQGASKASTGTLTPFIRSLIHSLFNSSSHSFIQLTHLFIRPFIHTLTHLFTHSFIYSTHSFVHLPIHSHINSSIRSFIDLFINSFIYSCTHSFICLFIPTLVGKQKSSNQAPAGSARNTHTKTTDK